MYIVMLKIQKVHKDLWFFHLAEVNYIVMETNNIVLWVSVYVNASRINVKYFALAAFYYMEKA